MTEWEAKQAVMETINSYSGAAGRLDIDAFIDHFLPEAELHGIGNLLKKPEPFRGHDDIRAAFATSFSQMEWLSQMNTITSVELGPDGKTARTVTNLVEMAKRREAPQIVLIARYEDELALTEDGWKFARRTLVPLRFSIVP